MRKLVVVPRKMFGRIRNAHIPLLMAEYNTQPAQHTRVGLHNVIIPSILLFRVDTRTLDAHKRIRSRRFTGLDNVVKLLYTVALRQLDHIRATI